MPFHTHSTHTYTCAQFPRNAGADACAAARREWERKSKRLTVGDRPERLTRQFESPTRAGPKRDALLTVGGRCTGDTIEGAGGPEDTGACPYMA